MPFYELLANTQRLVIIILLSTICHDLYAILLIIHASKP